MKTTPEDAFQALLEGHVRRAPAGLAALGLLAAALEPASREEPDARFRRRVRSELIAQASMSEEDIFAAAIDRDLVGAVSISSGRVGALVALASALEPAAPVLPDTRFRYGLRARLVEMATAKPPLRERLASAVAARSARMRHSLRIVTATGVAAMTLLVSGATMVAAQDALPGDLVYGAKLAQESISLWTVSGSNEGLRKLNFGRRRLGEVRGLTERDVTQRLLYTDTLNRMDTLTIDATALILAHATEAPSAVKRLSNFAAVQASDLSALLERLPPEVRPAARDSLGVIASAGAKADAALNGCGTCPTDAVTMPGTDATLVPPSAAGSQGCSVCGGSGETSDPEMPGGDGGSGPGDPAPEGETPDGDGTPPTPAPTPPADEAAVDLPPVDSTEADEAAEKAVDDLLDQLGVTPPAGTTIPSVPSVTTTTTPSLPVFVPGL